MDTALEILGITGPIYLAIALGYVATRHGYFAKADLQAYGKFVIQLALPALIFHALATRRVGEVMNAPYMASYALAGLGTVAAAWFYARRVRGHSRSLSSVIAMGMSCPNSGFVGYPILLLTFGANVAGVVLALNMVVENLLIIPLLLALGQSEQGAGQWRAVFAQTARGLVRNPLIWAIVGGFLFSLLGLTLPAPVSRTVNLFAAASGALSLFVIGGSLVGIEIAGMRGQIVMIAAGKLLLHPLWVLPLWWLVPIQDPSLRHAVLLSCAMPMMGIYTILAQRLGHGPISAAALVVTTVASFFTLTTLLWVLQTP